MASNGTDHTDVLSNGTEHTDVAVNGTDQTDEYYIDESGRPILLRYRNAWFGTPQFPNKDQFEKYRNFQINSDDIIVASFPKSGTTWIQAIVQQIMSDAGTLKVKNGILDDTFPHLEFWYPGLEVISSLPSPRLMKTHFPYDFLPTDIIDGKGKMIYIARNIKDVFVSYYYMIRMIKLYSYRGSIADQFQNFVNGRVAYGPWTDHVQDYWRRRDNDNILFVTYEDLHKDTAAVVKQVSEFLGRPLTEDRISEIVRLTKFEEMKNNPQVNYSWWDKNGMRNEDEAEFMRKGEVGDWRNHLTAEMSEEFDTKCLQSLQDLGLFFADKS